MKSSDKMNKLLTVKLLGLFIALFFAQILRGQKDYQYRRALSAVSGTWHSITLVDSLYQRLSNRNDMRILGITAKGDTVEVPYIFQENTEGGVLDIPFTLLNKTSNEKGFFYTFKTPNEATIDKISLFFGDENFDWLVDVEGSSDQKTWFTIAENQRLTGISNAEMEFRYTKLNFEKVAYAYIRLCIKTDKAPSFQSASLFKSIEKKRKFRDFGVKSTTVEQDKAHKQTFINLDLGLKVPVSNLVFSITNQLDYARSFSIRYRKDTIKPQTWYTVTYGNLNSKNTLSFEFDPIVTDALQIIIDNGDNMPLDFGKITVKGEPYTLLARFTEKAKYYLYYGNKKSYTAPPQYDIANFRSSIPTNPVALSLGFEEPLFQNKAVVSTPSFFNKWWLWGVMLVIILGLGRQTLKMMGEKNG